MDTGNLALHSDISVAHNHRVQHSVGAAIRAVRKADPFWNQAELATRANVAISTVVNIEKGRNFERDTLLKVVKALEEKDHEQRLQALITQSTPSISTDLVAAGQTSATGVAGMMSDPEDPNFQTVRQLFYAAKALGPDAEEQFMRRVLNLRRTRATGGKEPHVKKARRR
jgi:DNA-binding XRE family transcriptional regulator